MVVATRDSEQTVGMEANTLVVDVRTPGEIALGVLEGAIEMDWNGASFVNEVSQLDRAAAYVVYCRSGYRAGEAVEAMKELGFTNLTNAGSLAEAAELTGLPIITR